MFTIVSGLPGAGKTLHTIAHYKKLNDDLIKQKKSPRSVFYHGIPLTEEGSNALGWTELTSDEVKNWPDNLPTGAILIVDEAQKHWPVRSPSKAIPPELREIETHRHKGVDLVFITQDPTLLDSHARKLANEHTHFIRPHGAKYSKRYHSGSGVVSVNNKSELNALVVSRVGHPKHIYNLYKSAEVHTHKFRPPKLLFYFFGALIVLCIFIYKIQGSSFFNPEDAQTSSNTSLQSSTVSTSPPPAEITWSALLTPEIKGLPYTAPLYRQRATEVTEVPRIAGCAEFKELCHCFTQQGTVIHDINQSACKNRMKYRPFDHLVYNQRENVARSDMRGRNDSQVERATSPRRYAN